MTRLRHPAAVVGVLLLATGCATSPPVADPDQRPGRALQVAAVGDSITEADSDDFDLGDIGPGSWASYADGDGVRIVGGWAHAGATTSDMLTGVIEDKASGAVVRQADTLVLMGGSNDLDAGVPIPTILHNLASIVSVEHAHHVTLSAVPPEAAVQDAVDELNARLPELAEREGWQFVDPLVDVRAADGSWLAGMSDDGVHPTQQAAELIGLRLGAAVRG